jgi:hypothetical protein
LCDRLAHPKHAFVFTDIQTLIEVSIEPQESELELGLGITFLGLGAQTHDLSVTGRKTAS